MKNIYYLFAGIISLTVLFGSCAKNNNVVSNSFISKRKHLSGWHVNSKNSEKRNNSKIDSEPLEVASNKTRKLKEDFPEQRFETKNEIVNNDYSSTSDELFLVNQSKSKNSIKNDSQIIINSQEEECAEIILKNGDIIKAVISEVGVNEVKYKKCENLGGPVYSILKKEVFMIKYANGTKDVFKEDEPKNNEIDSSKNNYEGEPNFDYLGLVGILLAIVAVIVFIFASWFIGAIMGLFPIIFGAISLSKEQKNPGFWSTGKALGSISLTLGIILLIAAIGFTVLFFV